MAQGKDGDQRYGISLAPGEAKAPRAVWLLTHKPFMSSPDREETCERGGRGWCLALVCILSFISSVSHTKLRLRDLSRDQTDLGPPL